MPKDIKLADDAETFTITVRYDTKELYGKVEASRTFVLKGLSQDCEGGAPRTEGTGSGGSLGTGAKQP